jgi:hypothetical protein
VTQIGKALLVASAMLAVVGAAFYFSDRLPWIQRFGRLPGDFTFTRGNLRIYVPLTTCLLLSLVASAILYFLRRR